MLSFCFCFLLIFHFGICFVFTERSITSWRIVMGLFKKTMTKNQLNLFRTINGTQIKLYLIRSSSALEIVVENVSYIDERNNKLKHIMMEILCYGLCFILILPQYLIVNVAFGLLLIFQFYTLMSLVKFGEHHLLKWIFFSKFFN